MEQKERLEFYAGNTEAALEKATSIMPCLSTP